MSCAEKPRRFAGNRWDRKAKESTCKSSRRPVGKHSFVVELLEDEQWRPRVLSRGLADSLSWFDALAEHGVWERWLASDDEAKIDAAWWQCRANLEARGDIVRALLLPYWTNGQEVWRRRIAETLAHDPAADTPELFEWRLELVRSGDALRPGLWYHLPKLAAKYPRRAIELLGHTPEAGAYRQSALIFVLPRRTKVTRHELTPLVALENTCFTG